MTRQSTGPDPSPPDVMLALRTGTADEHRELEDTLDLLDPALTADRLILVLARMHAFWVRAEHGLDAWARTHPADAAAVDWAARRRSGLFAADLVALGGDPDRPAPVDVPAPVSTDEALGAMYVLEGSTLGGVFIDRHLATLPGLSQVGPLASFSPYGEQTGARWAAFRRVVRDHVARGGEPDALVAAARRTFAVMAAWCSDIAPGAPGTSPRTTRGGVPA